MPSGAGGRELARLPFARARLQRSPLAPSCVSPYRRHWSGTPCRVGGVGEEKGREGCVKATRAPPARASHGGARARLGAAGRVRACAGRRRAAVRTRAFRVSRGGASGDVMSGPARRGGSGPVQSGRWLALLDAHFIPKPFGDASRRARAAVARCAPWRPRGRGWESRVSRRRQVAWFDVRRGNATFANARALLHAKRSDSAEGVCTPFEGQKNNLCPGS